MTKRQVEICLARYVRGLPPNAPVPQYVYDLWEWMENGQRDVPRVHKTNELAPVVPIDMEVPKFITIVKRRFLKSNIKQS